MVVVSYFYMIFLQFPDYFSWDYRMIGRVRALFFFFGVEIGQKWGLEGLEYLKIRHFSKHHRFCALEAAKKNLTMTFWPILASKQCSFKLS